MYTFNVAFRGRFGFVCFFKLKNPFLFSFWERWLESINLWEEINYRRSNKNKQNSKLCRVYIKTAFHLFSLYTVGIASENGMEIVKLLVWLEKVTKTCTYTASYCKGFLLHSLKQFLLDTFPYRTSGSMNLLVCTSFWFLLVFSKPADVGFIPVRSCSQHFLLNFLKFSSVPLEQTYIILGKFYGTLNAIHSDNFKCLDKDTFTYYQRLMAFCQTFGRTW